jgi:RNA-directed DNA polymerase
VSAAGKPFSIDKKLVYEAYKVVKANAGAAGVDGQTIAQFDADLRGNLYKLWNRMSSGSYFPLPVRAVAIPKKSGGQRLLGVPTVADRVAQMVVKRVIEADLEAVFLADSYGYRPGKSALDAVGVTRQRCWEHDWVLEFDIKGLFDNIDHTLLLRAVRKHVTCPWAVLYIERWLTAPMIMEDGARVERTRGTPQGGVVSPVLANLFLHYAFDLWMTRIHPELPWCRYADDGLVHCRTEQEAGRYGRASGPAGAMPPGDASDKDQDRLLQGWQPQGKLCQPGLRLPGIWLSATAGEEFPAGQPVLELHAGGQPGGPHRHAGDDTEDQLAQQDPDHAGRPRQ